MKKLILSLFVVAILTLQSAMGALFFHDTFSEPDGTDISLHTPNFGGTTYTDNCIESNEFGDIQEGAFRVGRTSKPSNSCNAESAFTSQNLTQDFQLSWSMKQEISKGRGFMSLYEENTEKLRVGMIDDNLQVSDGKIFKTLVSGVTLGRWYSFTIKNVNFSSNTFDVEIDGIEYNNNGSHWNFELNASKFTEIHYVYDKDAAAAHENFFDNVTITVCEPSDEVCDGVDNDCDGTIDEDVDTDGDGVAECTGEDVCLSSTLPDVLSGKFNPNHYADVDGDGVFEFGEKTKKPLSITLEDTAGCSCSDIASMLPGENAGWLKHGCPKGIMQEWIADH